MAVRRRRASAPKGPSAPSSRVHAVETLQQWNNMLEKAAKSGRLVVLQLYAVSNYACSQMRAYFKRMSVEAALKGAVYAEVDVDGAEEELLEDVGMVTGVTKIPCYRCYIGGEEVETYSGGTPTNVSAMIQRQLSTLRSRRGGLLTKLLLAAGGAAAVAAGLYWHLGRAAGAAGAGPQRNLSEELRALGDRTRLAQKRKLNCERAGKLKGAKNQARLLKQLEGQLASVQQLMQAEREKGNPAAAAAAGGQRSRRASGSGDARGSAAPAAAAGGGRRKGRGRQEAGPSPLPYGMEPCDYSSEEDGSGSAGGRSRSSSRRRSRRAAHAVAYSDEE